MIPLALYSLDYPRVPLLLADFRHSLTPKRREMVSQGVTGIGHRSVRHHALRQSVVLRGGCDLDVRARPSRRRCQSHRPSASLFGARQFLAMDSSLDPALKIELQRHLDHLALNPRENEISHEATLAREQYAALLQYADSPRGAAKLERDRRKELEVLYPLPSLSRIRAARPNLHSRAARRSREADLSLRAQLDAYRRSAYHVRFLEQVLAVQPPPRCRVGRRCDPPIGGRLVARIRTPLPKHNASSRRSMPASGDCGSPFRVLARPASFQPASSPGRRRERVGHRRRARPVMRRPPALLLFASLLASLLHGPLKAAEVKRVVIIKLDGVPENVLERELARIDPVTHKSTLPWIDHVFAQGGTRLDNFYVRAISLSTPSWSLLDTGQHLQIHGNAEFDRYTYHVYDYMNFFPFYLGYARSHRVDMPGVEVLDEPRNPAADRLFPLPRHLSKLPALPARRPLEDASRRASPHRFSHSLRELAG